MDPHNIFGLISPTISLHDYENMVYYKMNALSPRENCKAVFDSNKENGYWYPEPINES